MVSILYKLLESWNFAKFSWQVGILLWERFLIKSAHEQKKRERLVFVDLRENKTGCKNDLH